MMRMSLSREDIISLLPTVTSFLASRVRRAGVGLRPHPVQPGPAAAGHHEGAGEQLVAGGLGDGVGLAGDEGLVDLHLAGEDGGVGGDLVAGGQLRHVIPHQLGGGHGDQVPLPHHVGPGGGPAG